MDDENKDLKPAIVRTLQIIVPSLALGLLVFGLVAFFMRQGGDQPGNGAVFLSPLMAGLTVVLIFARILVPGLMVRSGCHRIARGVQPPGTSRKAKQPQPSNEDEQLVAVYSAKTIVGGAILEGAGFGNLTAYLLEGQVYSLALAGLLIVVILAGIPTRHALDNWLGQARRRIQEIRALSSLR